jgi:hypothetical protein
MNNDNPLICQGTAPPAAKKEVISLPFLENAKPETKTPTVRITTIIMSKMPIVSYLKNDITISTPQRYRLNKWIIYFIYKISVNVYGKVREIGREEKYRI